MNGGQSTHLHQNANDRLIVDRLSCLRGGRLLFRDLSFSLEPGQAGLVTGPNGVGKSSLLRLIAGLLAAVSGSIQASEKLALCDEHLALDEQLPFGKAMQFWAKVDGQPESFIDAALIAAGLDHLAEVPVRYFSAGQRQRARLARTYLSGLPGTSLWLLDEPANGLDSASVGMLGTALRNHLDSGGIILAASHIELPMDFNLSLELAPPPDHQAEQVETVS